MNWRSTTIEVRTEFLGWAQGELSVRQVLGDQRFRDEFQGDPLDHLIEELLDALFYAWMERRKRAAG